MGVADEVRKRDVGAIRKRAEVDFHGFVKRFGFHYALRPNIVRRGG
jgi:hypothetical protein